jgi:hypothetical protein
MNKILIILVVVCLSINLHAQGNDFPYEKAGELKDAALRVKMLNEDSYVLQDTKDDSKRYYAVNLPDVYKKDGLNLICSGIIGKVPPNFRMVGTPLKLTAVKVGKGYKKLKVKVKSFKFE